MRHACASLVRNLRFERLFSDQWCCLKRRNFLARNGSDYGLLWFIRIVCSVGTADPTQACLRDVLPPTGSTANISQRILFPLLFRPQDPIQHTAFTKHVLHSTTSISNALIHLITRNLLVGVYSVRIATNSQSHFICETPLSL